jgi:isopentenyl-diphosphate delta-isomerase
MDRNTHDGIVRRKSDHIDVVLRGDVDFGRLTAGFEAIHFEHNALPELALADIDLSTHLLDRSLRAPFLISSMTGGPERAARINRHLGEAAEALGLALAVGSQRIALEDQGTAGLDHGLRSYAPNVPLLANLGAAQIRGADGVDRARAVVEMIGADAIYIHLNPLQEAVQHGGDTDWRGVLDAIDRLSAAGVKVAVKEVGFGLSATVVRRLSDVGVSIIDVAGAGGTNWARVEGARSEGRLSAIAETFREWGVPTAHAIREARNVAPDATIVGSGGIKTGLDAAKALRMGADIIGQAASTLAAAVQSTEAVVEHFATMIETLRITCFATGSRDLAALRSAPLLGGD